MKRPLVVFGVLAALVGTVVYRHYFAPDARHAPVERAARVGDDRPHGGPSSIELVHVRTTNEPPELGSFSGRVTSNGAGVAGAELTFSRGEAVSTTLTDSTGAFVFRPTAGGTYELTGIVAAACLPYRDRDGAVRLEARPGRAVTGLLFQLVAEKSLIVEVTDGTVPLAGVHIAIHTPGTAAFAAPRTAVTGKNGRVQVGGAAGDLVEASLEGWETTVLVVIEDSSHGSLMTAHITLVRGTDARDTINGVVVDEDGHPIDGVEVALYTGARMQGDAVSGADGTFSIGSSVADNMRLRATKASYVPDEQPVSNARVTLRLRRGCIVKGHVKDKEGPSVASFTVVVRRVAGDGPTPGSPTSYDAEGQFEVRAMTPGRYSLQVLAAGYAPSVTRVVEVSESCGLVEADFALGHGGTVYGRVSDHKTGQALIGTVQLEGYDDGAGMDVRSSMTTDSSGHYEIGGLPAGRRSILATADGHHNRIVAGIDVRDGDRTGPVDVELDDVPAGETARTQLTGIGAVLSPGDGVLRLQAAIPGGGAETAGLGKGDQIITVDGNEIRNMGFEEATNAIRGPENTTVTLEVKKATGATVTLVVQRKVVR